MGNDAYITRHQAAHIANVHLRTIDRWLAEGILTSHRIRTGRTVRIERAELDKLLTPTPHGD